MGAFRWLICCCLLLAISPAPAKEGAKGASHAVSIKGNAFAPAALTIKAGDSVTWTNADQRDHTVAARDGSFNSGNIGSGGSFTFRFVQPGNYPYGCSLHPRMRGSITVQ